MRKFLLFIIIGVFFLENVELDSICLSGVEFAHYRADFIRENLTSSTKIQHFIYSPTSMYLVNHKELIVDDEYFDIVREEYINDEHHIYCIADKGEGALMKFISWVRSRRESKSPFSAGTFVKNKLKSLKYFAERSKIIKASVAQQHYKGFLSIEYLPPTRKIPVPPPIV